MKGIPELKTKRLLLRAFTLDDAEQVQKLAGAKEIAAVTLNIPHPYGDGMAEEWISSHLHEYIMGRSLTLAICLEDGSLCGAIGLIINQSNMRGSLGYWIGKEFWGKGYCTEAAQAIMEFGFTKLKLARIYATHLSHNPASGRVMQKLGMKQEGILRQHEQKWGQTYDLVYYGILSGEYFAGKQL